MSFESQESEAATFPWLGTVKSGVTWIVSLFPVQHSSWVRKRSKKPSGSASNNIRFSCHVISLVHFGPDIRRLVTDRAETFLQNILTGYTNRIGYLFFSQSPRIHNHLVNTINIFVDGSVEGNPDLGTSSSLSLLLLNSFELLIKLEQHLLMLQPWMSLGAKPCFCRYMVPTQC